jgi:CheY-like chemotaxis protein
MSTNEPRPRVLLADDYVAILGALKQMLEPSCDVVGAVTDGIALLDATASLEPDVVVLDLHMPKINGLEACRQIKEASSRTKVVLLTAAADGFIKERALGVGASAFVEKHRVADDLLLAIHEAFAGTL